MSILPKKNELGFFEIRLESIGGLGANLAGKMLRKQAFLASDLTVPTFHRMGQRRKDHQ